MQCCAAVYTCVDVNCVEGASAESKTLIVRNLSYDTSEDDLKGAFDSAVTCRVMTYPDSGKSKGSVVLYRILSREFLLIFCNAFAVWAMMT